MDNVLRELRFALRDNVLVLAVLVAGLLSTFTVVSGLKETAAEKALIERVENLVDEDRAFALADLTDAGSAAYYAFHFTYDSPTSLAFAARGVRDDLPWKHRIRMLAIEGQIYETDAGNPELSRIGKLDFAFVAAFLLPLLTILVLHDLRASEQRSNRWAFLAVTSGDGGRLLRGRAVLRAGLLYIALVVPFAAGAVASGASLVSIGIVFGAVALNMVFWLAIAMLITTRVESGPTAAALLLGVWFVLAVAVPVGGKLAVEASVPVPKGGEILLAQREAVNDGWDLPKDATMSPFIERHPEWADTPPISQPFEWRWYYAFHQVGDQTVEGMSSDLRAGITTRDQAMGKVAFVSPPLMAQRLLAFAAGTDVASFQQYDVCVRSFHARLREFHYPMLFGDVPYSNEHMKKLPTFVPCNTGDR